MMKGDAQSANAVSAAPGGDDSRSGAGPATAPRPESAASLREPRPHTSPAAADRDLVVRIAGGDEDALRLLLGRHGDFVFALARSILQEAADAEETAADVFLQVWRTARTFDPARGGVPAWLATITRSRALDRLRSRRVRSGVLTLVSDPASRAADLATPARDAPDGGVEAMETRRLVEAALRELPEAQRDVIELAYFSGLSQSEIAAKLSVPLGTVKTRTLYALTRLRERLGPLLREGVA